MNCPACGAPNETEAQFCAECGSPLENNEIQETIAGQTWPVDSEPFDVDPTADESAKVSKPDISSDLPAATEAVTENQIAPPTTVPESDDQPVSDEVFPPPIEDEPAITEPPEIAAPPAEPSPQETPADETGAGRRKMPFIVGGVALLFIIICCCCSVFVGAIFGILTSEEGQQILRELSALSVGWSAV